MAEKCKHSVKRVLFLVEEYLGSLIGLCGRLSPRVFDKFFLALISHTRKLPDRIFLLSFPFVEEMGKSFYDQGEEHKLDLSMVNGACMRVDISEKTQRNIYIQKIFEAGLTRYLLSVLKEGDTVVDVGANVGYFTILMAKIVGPEGRVVSVEPELHNLEALRENIKINDFQNITVCACAVGKEESTQVLNINPLNRGGNSLIPFVEYKSGGVKYSAEEVIEKFGKERLFQKVRVRTLDDIAKENKLDTVAFMKMDVEGFEHDALMGARELLKERRVQRIVCEISNKDTRDAVLALFRDSRYAPYAISFSGEPVSLAEGCEKYPRDILFVSPEL